MKKERYRDGIDGGILDDDRIRIIIIGVLILLAFAVIVCRLYFLQLHRGEEHRKLIAKQSERFVRLAGLRGCIYSADNVLLAGNRQAYDLLFFPSEMHRGRRKKTVRHMHTTAAALAGAIGRDEFPGEKEFNNHLRNDPGIPMTVFRDLNSAELARALEASRDMEGVDIQFSPVRYYPGNSLASHIIGYTRKIDYSTASDRKDFRYYTYDIEGKSGIELAFDTFNSFDHTFSSIGLRAMPGRAVIQVNNIGYAHKELLGRTEPVNGNDLILTINHRAQKIAEELLEGYTGALVVVDADNGDIICAASSPRHDLGQFSPRLDPEYYRQLLKDPRKPLINRAFQAIYPPGSTIKPLMCLAFLKAGANPDEEIFCPGDSTVGNTTIGCSAHRYYGDDMTMIRALEKSCNNYMITNALKIGMEPMAEMFKAAGFGSKNGLPIPEAAGTLPSRELKLKRYKTRWNNYDTALLSIGQGIIAVTPLQLALYTAAIANGGTLWQGQLVHKMVDGRGITRYEPQPLAVGKLPVSEEQLEIIRQGMFQVVNSSGGSGRQGKVDGLTIYGKTGTAETGSKSNRRNITHFIAFTYYREKSYALAVTIEDGRSGGKTCAPLAAGFFRKFCLDSK
ncbi:MAG: hypothetical protein IJW33_01615 [Lentisphaeria bacterium]|nr:hypothetical protein [Lentisphaeria bacterium]